MSKRDTVKKLLSRINIKKTLIGIAVAIVILLPTALAISNVIYTNKIAAARSLTVVLYDEDRNELYRADGTTDYEGEASLTGIFKAINSNMVKTDGMPEGTVTEKPLIAELITESSTTELTCYFSFTQGGSYCSDTSDQYYRISAADSERFLASEFSEVLYKDATPPILSTGDGDTVAPSSVVWSYKNIDDIYMRATKSNKIDSILTYNATGSISLFFETEPDFCAVSIYQDSTKIFEGAPDELPSLILDSSTLLNMKVRAVWNESSGYRYYGETNYDFNIIVHNRADFSISSDILVRGDFIVLSATQITDPSKLIFTSDDSDFVPIFTHIGENAYAVIPYPDDLNSSKYTFTISYGVSAKTFTVNTDKNASLTDSSKLIASADILGIDLKLAELSVLNRYLLDGSLVPPSGFIQGLSYGDNFTYNKNQIYSIFNEYKCDGTYGIDITSVSAGMVVRVGNSENMGEYIVLDIGLGLKVWYFNLSSVDVSVGDLVAAGDIIGTTSSLLNGDEGYSVMLTYYSTPLDINCLFD